VPWDTEVCTQWSLTRGCGERFLWTPGAGGRWPESCQAITDVSHGAGRVRRQGERSSVRPNSTIGRGGLGNESAGWPRAATL
jgi:hypothetical protein